MSALVPKACPFCGGDDVSVTDATRFLGVWRLLHRCPVIGAVEIQNKTREGAIAVWNTRAPDTGSAGGSVE